jgi:hypothetical protein
MPRESFSAAYERSHPYPSTSTRPPQVPAELPTSPMPREPSPTAQTEPSPAPNEDYDSDNEVWQEILEEAAHDARKFPQFSFNVPI